MKRYCARCEYFEKRPVMAEVEMDSGVYVQNGWYHRCKYTGRVFPTAHYSGLDLETMGCYDHPEDVADKVKTYKNRVTGEITTDGETLVDWMELGHPFDLLDKNYSPVLGFVCEGGGEDV